MPASVSPAQSDRNWENGSTAVASVRVVIAALDVNLGLLSKPVREPAADVVSAGADAIGRKSLRRDDEAICANDPPQLPGRLANRAGPQHLTARSHVALIPSTAANRIHAQLALERKVEESVQSGRLQVPRCVTHELIGLHAVLEPEIEIHILGLESEGAAEIHSAAGNPVIRRPRKLAHVSQRAAKPAAD